MTTLLIGAHEGRKLISFDVPGAFLQAEMAENKLVLLKLKGKFMDMMCKINPEFKPHVQYETTRDGTLKGLGYELNPYNKCVTNK
eukprot:10096948-Ditylum_brightwellii.AAC.1